MYFVYLLKGTLKNFYYTGCTDNLKERFKKHNQGEVKLTKPYMPFKLIYYEACLNGKDAYLRGKYLKTRLGKTFLRKRLKHWFNNLA